MKEQQTVTIQKTNKKYKLLLALSYAGMIFSFVGIMVFISTGKPLDAFPIFIAGMLAASAFTMAITKIAVWWNHE